MRDDLIHLDELGRGCSAIVRRSIHLPTLKLVACKEIQVHDEMKRSQLCKEIKALYVNLVNITDGERHPASPRCASVGHIPHVVSMYDAFTSPSSGTVSVILEYMDGGSLQNIIDRGGLYDEPWLAKISSQLLLALKSIHGRNLLHRDIKPGKIPCPCIIYSYSLSLYLVNS